MQIDSIILGPVLTEKATKLAGNKVYMFYVDKKANKFQIKEALEKLFSVKIGRIASLNRKGKIKKVGRKMIPKKSQDKRIVYVQLKSGKIDIFPQA